MCRRGGTTCTSAASPKGSRRAPGPTGFGETVTATSLGRVTASSFQPLKKLSVGTAKICSRGRTGLRLFGPSFAGRSLVVGARRISVTVSRTRPSRTVRGRSSSGCSRRRHECASCDMKSREAILNYLVGECMWRASRRGNPAIFRELLVEELKRREGDAGR